MFCPICQREYPEEVTRCPDHDVPLVWQRPAATAPDARVVSVFEAADQGQLDLATMALDEEGIPHTTRTAGLSAVFGYHGQSQTPGTREVFGEVLVAADVESRAREVLADLAAARDTIGRPLYMSPQGGIGPGPQGDDATAPAVVALRNAATNGVIGHITRAQLQFLRDHLEEESPEDDDYFVDASTIDMLEGDKADPALIAVLKQAVGTSEGIDVRWEES
jgi:hypothetical protein